MSKINKVFCPGRDNLLMRESENKQYTLKYKLYIIFESYKLYRNSRADRVKRFRTVEDEG